jgi:hypothetical protein
MLNAFQIPQPQATGRGERIGIPRPPT